MQGLAFDGRFLQSSRRLKQLLEPQAHGVSYEISLGVGLRSSFLGTRRSGQIVVVPELDMRGSPVKKCLTMGELILSPNR